MTHHVVLGGGPAATNALETLRDLDSECQITLVSDEPAHSRMALPYWLAGQIPREQTYTGDDDYFQSLAVTTRFGVRARQLDTHSRQLKLDDGSAISFDNLLLATGSTPRGPRMDGIDLPGVQPMWNLAHVESVLDLASQLSRPRVVLVGAGFIGFIVLGAMFKRNWSLAVVEREPQVLPRMLDRQAAEFVQQWLKQRGVEVYTKTNVRAISAANGIAKRVELDSGQVLEADIVIIATGVSPNVDLVAGTGIKTDVGILVNDRMQTNVAGIYAAGDVAQGPALFADGPQVHAIQPTAVDHGRVAGANMAGREVHYAGSLLMNVVDVCGLQCASYGSWNDPAGQSMVIAGAGRSIYRKLVWRDDQIVGAIFTGGSNDLGMLTDLGMVKGLMQTQTRMGNWKGYLAENPFDIRRAYIACGAASKLAESTLLGQPSRPRRFRFGNAQPDTAAGPAHRSLFETRVS